MTPPQKYSLIPDPEFGGRVPQDIYLRGWQRAESIVRIVQAEFLRDRLPLALAECLFDEAFLRIERYSRKFPLYYAMTADFARCPDPDAAESIFTEGFCDALTAGRDETMANPTYHGPSSDEDDSLGAEAWEIPRVCDCDEDSAK